MTEVTAHSTVSLSLLLLLKQNLPFVHLIIIYQESAILKKVKNSFAFKNYSGRFTRYELFYDISKKK